MGFRLPLLYALALLLLQGCIDCYPDCEYFLPSQQHVQVFKARYHTPWQWTFEDAHGSRQVLQSTPIDIQQRPRRSEQCPGSCDGQDYELAVQRPDSAVLRFVVYGVFSRTDQHTMYVGECNGPRIECRANGFAEPYSIFHVKDYHLGAGASLHPLNGQILATHRAGRHLSAGVPLSAPGYLGHSILCAGGRPHTVQLHPPICYSTGNLSPHPNGACTLGCTSLAAAPVGAPGRPVLPVPAARAVRPARPRSSARTYCLGPF